MRRWTIAQTLLSTKLLINPSTFVPRLSLSSHQSCSNFELSSVSCTTRHRCCCCLAPLEPQGKQQQQQQQQPTIGKKSHQLCWSKNNDTSTTRTFVTVRGGSSETSNTPTSVDAVDSHQTMEQEYTVLSDPAPGSPFHYAFPVHDLELAKQFYGTVLGCIEGRSSAKWQDYSLHGHQIVAHWVGDTYRCHDYYNPVDGDEVPVPHTGLTLTVDQFHELANRLRNAGVQFIIEPHLRFKGMPGEQYTMFFKDPSGNNLEFKAMTHPENLFAKYNVADN